MRVTTAELAALVHGELVRGDAHRSVSTRASIDSRTVERDQIFFAIVGDKQDGHAFVAQALAAGAAGVVVSRERGGPVDASSSREADDVSFVIRVEDTTRALQDLATGVRARARARREDSLRVVAVTGSMGKTTTKDAAAAALSSTHSVLKSEGNLNNHWGLPLSLARLDDETVAVLEMGMSAPGEIARLCEIARPDVGVVTNVAEAHLEFFGTIEKIAEAKGELYFGLAPGGVAVVNADDPLVLRQAEATRVQAQARGGDIRKILFGLESAADVTASAIETSEQGLRFTAEYGSERAQVRSRLFGRHNLYNLLAGLAASSALDVPLADAAGALESLEPARHRGERIPLRGGITLVDETYNSNPRALDASLDLLAEEAAKRRIAVVGDMLELGAQAGPLHRAAGRGIAERGIDLLVAVGSLASEIARGAEDAGMATRDIFAVDDVEAAGEKLETVLRDGDVALLKGSRSVGLDRAVDRIVAFFGTEDGGAVP